MLLTLKLNVHFAKSFSRDRGSEIGNRESHRTLGLGSEPSERWQVTYALAAIIPCRSDLRCES